MRTTSGTFSETAFSGDHAFGDHVATHDAAEDVDQDGLQAWVFQHDLEGFGHFLGRGAAHVQEVGWLAAEQLDGVHGGHGQAGAVHQAADVAVERDVGQVEFRSFDFRWIFFVQIAEGDDFRVTEQGVGSKLNLASRAMTLPLPVTISGLISASERRFPVRFVQALQVDACIDDGTGRHADFGAMSSGRRSGRRWIDGDVVDLLRVALGHFFDVHAAFGRGHQDDLLGDAVGDQRNVQFLLDVGAFFDQQAATFWPSGRSGA
jgi:hypothetical protein